MAFPKDLRLRSAQEFQTVYREGVKKSSPSFVVFVRPNGCENSRFGFTTPRRLGKAHERNRIKRRLREIVRSAKTSVPIGFDIVVNPRRSAHDRDLKELRLELISLLGTAI